MSPDKQAIQELIAASLTHLRADLGLPELSSVDASTAVLGADSDLDSMAVVHLIVDLEASLQEAYGRNWILADERALSRSRSPFRTVGDLADFIIETVPEP
jgi:acyl carrier protein